MTWKMFFSLTFTSIFLIYHIQKHCTNRINDFTWLVKVCIVQFCQNTGDWLWKCQRGKKCACGKVLLLIIKANICTANIHDVCPQTLPCEELFVLFSPSLALLYIYIYTDCNIWTTLAINCGVWCTAEVKFLRYCKNEKSYYEDRYICSH